MPVHELVPHVAEWADQLGRTPSRNQIMARFRVGAPKASKALAALTGDTDQQPDREATRPLRVLRSAEPDPDTEAVAAEPAEPETSEPETEVIPAVDPEPDGAEPVRVAAPPAEPHRVRPWPLVLLALPAFVAVWGGWVGLGGMTGFGPISLLPGIADHVVINSAITLPIGVEAYAAFALRVWLASGDHSAAARRFAMWSAFGALVLGMAGQVAYHLMSAAGMVSAPWVVTMFVSCLPVGVLGCGAALAHLLNTDKGVQR